MWSAGARGHAEPEQHHEGALGQGQAERLSYVGRGTLALRARPVAQLRCSVIFSAIVLASGTVWLEVSGRCAAAN